MRQFENVRFYETERREVFMKLLEDVRS